MPRPPLGDRGWSDLNSCEATILSSLPLPGGLRPPGDLEVHLIAFVQGFVSLADDFLEVDEHIFARFTLNESEALGSVEPLHCPFFHGTDPLDV